MLKFLAWHGFEYVAINIQIISNGQRIVEVAQAMTTSHNQCRNGEVNAGAAIGNPELEGLAHGFLISGMVMVGLACASILAVPFQPRGTRTSADRFRSPQQM